MGLIRAIFRFIFTLGGLLEGSTQRATDAMLTASADTIRSQFRKAQEDAKQDYNQMRDAVAELCKLHANKSAEVDQLNTRAKELSSKMSGAIELYKRNNDENLREMYGRLASEREKAAQRAQELMEQMVNEEALIEQYKARLVALQESINKLKEEEAQTIADIVSSRKINELNEKLSGLSQDTQTKNLDAIREARQKAKANAKLSSELSGTNNLDLENKLLSAGQSSAYMSEFDEAVKVERLFPAEAPTQQLEAPRASSTVSGESTEDKVNALFKS